jgi:hypothetical protein
MRNHALRLCLAAGAITMATSANHAADAVSQRRNADQLKVKIASISSRGETPTRQRTRTTVTENEVNAYLALEVADDFPTGIVNPAVSILGTDRVAARAVVDLDRVREERKPTSLLDPMRYLRGRLMVTATGVLQAREGIARFQLESAEVGGVPVPKLLLQQIVSYYSRSATRPSGISLDEPMALPARIQEILVERGQAVVVQ